MTSFKIIFVLFAMASLVFILSAFSYTIQPPDRELSLQSFETILKVLKSPRCMNCHPSDNYPRQGDDQHLHLFGVSRGNDNHGGLVQKCSTCHNDKNNDYTNIPGAPHWGLAPISMGWMGLSDAQLGQALLDKTKNGNRTPAQIVQHMKEDKLVLWAWNPGEKLAPPPVSLEEFRAALTKWLENGAAIPN